MGTVALPRVTEVSVSECSSLERQILQESQQPGTLPKVPVHLVP